MPQENLRAKEGILLDAEGNEIPVEPRSRPSQAKQWFSIAGVASLIVAALAVGFTLIGFLFLAFFAIWIIRSILVAFGVLRPRSTRSFVVTVRK